MPSMDAAYLERTGWASRKRSSMTMVYSSRILIERVLRDKVRELSNVVIREGVSVRGHRDRPTAAPPGPGHRRRLLDAAGGDERIDADLVVDALGRGSSVVRLAGGRGVARDAGADARRQGHLHLAVVRPPAPEDRPSSWWWQHIVVMPTQDKGEHPPEHEFLVNFFPIEGGRTIACMGSWGIDMPRTTDDFVASAERIRTPLFAAAMAECDPVSEVHLTRSTGNKWRRYDRLPRCRPASSSSATRSARSTRSTPRASARRRARR